MEEQQLPRGFRLQNGEYRIENKIGQGGFGITYTARWYQEARGAMGSVSNAFFTVVIKEFFWKQYCNRDPDGYTVSVSSSEGKNLIAQFKEKLKKEGKIISKLRHPNIVSILNIFEENNTAYLVMEHIEGESLSDIIKKRGKLDEQTTLKYAGQLCSALAEIHKNRILHLDIKPSNILIDEFDNVKVIDFGISKQYDVDQKETSDTPLGKSAGYSPVEQYVTLKSFSPPTDIYAAGATLYKMLTGETPIEAPIRVQNNADPLEAITLFNPNVSIRTEIAIYKAMSRFSDDRFQTIEEFAEALKGESDDEYWKKCTKTDARENYENYLLLYPKGQYKAAAERRITELRQEKELNVWHTCKETDTIAGYQDYLRLYPEGRYHTVAKEKIAELNTNKDKTVFEPSVTTMPERPPKSSPTASPSTVSSPSQSPISKPFPWKKVLMGSGIALVSFFVLMFFIGFFSPKYDPKDNACGGHSENQPFEIDGEKFSYSGEWSPESISMPYSGYDCLPSGKGKAIYEDGRIYEGDFSNGMRNGRGKLSFKNGDCYEGDIVDNKMSGIGKYVWSDSTYYDGTWENDTYKDGKIYDKDGKVQITYINGQQTK